MAGIKDFAIDVLAGVYADERVQAALAKLIREQVMPLVPLAAAAAAKALGEEMTKQFSKVLDMDPDIPGLSDVFDLIGDFLKNLGGR